MTMTERGDSTMKDGATRVRSSNCRKRQQAKSKRSRGAAVCNLIVDGGFSSMFFKSGENIRIYSGDGRKGREISRVGPRVRSEGGNGPSQEENEGRQSVQKGKKCKSKSHKSTGKEKYVAQIFEIPPKCVVNKICLNINFLL